MFCGSSIIDKSTTTDYSNLFKIILENSKGKGQNREPQQGIQEKKGPEKGEHKQFHAKSVDICDMLAKGIRVSFVGNSGEFGYFSRNSAVSAFCRT